MKKLKDQGIATQKSSKLNINYKITKENAKQHVVQVKNGGKDYLIYVNANPRAAQAVNGLTNPDAEQNPIFNAISTANRWLAANFTTRNPAFVMSNLSRDIIFLWRLSTSKKMENILQGLERIYSKPCL